MLSVCFLQFLHKFACFVICKNLLCLYSFTKHRQFMLLLNYYYYYYFFWCKNLDLLDWQRGHFDFSLSTFFVIFTSCGLKLSVQSLHPKQYVFTISFPVFIGFVFECVFFMPYVVGSIFLTIYFKHFDFIEWFDLNSNSRNLFERSSVSDF